MGFVNEFMPERKGLYNVILNALIEADSSTFIDSFRASTLSFVSLKQFVVFLDTFGIFLHPK